MKKLALAFACVLLALTACTKVSPTKLDYKYTVTVRGQVQYPENTNGIPGVAVEISISSGSPVTKITTVTDSDGKFKEEIPCNGKAGFYGSVQMVEDEISVAGMRFGKPNSATVFNTVKAGDETELLTIKTKKL